MFEIFVDQKTQQKSAPKDFLDQRHNHDQAHKAQHQLKPVKWRVLIEEHKRIEPGRARRKTEQRLRRDPDDEGNKPNKQRDPDSPCSTKIVLAPKVNQERAA